MEHLIKLITVFKGDEDDLLKIKQCVTKLKSADELRPSVIFHAINTGSFKLVSLLIGFIDPEVLKTLKTPRGRTSLIVAVKYPRRVKKKTSITKAVRKSLKIMLLLLGVGIPVDEKDGGGRTALMWAANLNSIKMVKLLMEHGASLTAVSNRKKLPFQYTTSFEVRELLSVANAEKTGDSFTITSSDFIPEEQCCVCLNETATVAFLPCKHQCICKGCAKKMNRCRYSMRSSQELISVSKKCPICRVRYTSTCLV